MNTHGITFWFSLVQAQYWHDPYDEESYALDCEFLSDINQELVREDYYLIIALFLFPGLCLYLLCSGVQTIL